MTLYTDAWLTGGPTFTGMGPYELINTVAAVTDELGPGLVLRSAIHLTYEPDEPVIIPSKSENRSWLSMTLDEEIAALISLILGIRMRSGGLTRVFRDGDVRGCPVAYEHRPPSWRSRPNAILPALRRATVSLDGVPPLLSRLPALDADEAVALVRAARQYQLAVWVADDEPELGWLHLVSAAEVAAVQWVGTRTAPAEMLKESLPDLAAVLDNAGGRPLLDAVAEHLKDLVKSTRRFLNFMQAFDPGPPSTRPEWEWAQVPWSDLRRRLGLIYKYRSDRLHGGIPFPSFLCRAPETFNNGPPSEVAPGLSAHAGPSHWPAKDLPMYLWVFERIVRGALLRWWHEHLGQPTPE